MKDLQRIEKSKTSAEKQSSEGHDLVFEGYEFPRLDDILTDEDSRRLILRRCRQAPRRAADLPSVPAAEAAAVYKTYVLEVKIAHKRGSEREFNPDLLAARMRDMGIDVVDFRMRPTVSAEFGKSTARVHRAGAPRKWEDDALADASRALSTLLTEEQRRQRRRAQVAAASRRLRERRKIGGSGEGGI